MKLNWKFAILLYDAFQVAMWLVVLISQSWAPLETPKLVMLGCSVLLMHQEAIYWRDKQ